MLKGLFQQSAWWVRSIVVLLVLSLLMLSSEAVVSLWLHLSGGDESLLLSDVRWLQRSQLIASCGIFCLGSLLCAYLLEGNALHFLHLDSPSTATTLLQASGSILFLVPFINTITEWNEQVQLPACLHALEEALRTMEKEATDLTNQLLSGTSLPALAYTLLLAALVPALGEELTFRGLLQGCLQKRWKNPHAAIWCSAFVFSFIHFQFYGFVSRLLLGALFGYLLLWSGSIWVPIAAHFLNNAIAVIGYWIYNSLLHTPMSLNEIGTTQTPWWMLLFSTAAGLVLLLKVWMNRLPTERDEPI